MGFEFQPSLRRMALHALALSYWSSDYIQTKFREYLFSRPRGGIKQYLIDLINEVVKKIDPESLPDFIYYELILAVKDIGYKMSDWFRYLRRHIILGDQTRRHIYDKFFRTIYWTHYGTINEVKILREFWLPNPSINIKKLYVMACILCEEDVIDNLWGIICRKRLRFNNRDLCEKPALHLVAYWIRLRRNDLNGFKKDVIQHNIPYVEVYHPEDSVEYNLLRLSISKGYASAVKYFWNKITEEERNIKIVECFYQALCLYRWYDKLNHEIYRKEKHTEIAMFLMNFLTEDSKRIVFTDFEGGVDLPFMRNKRAKGVFLIPFFMLIRMWPWHELLPSLFKEVKNYLGVEQYQVLVNAIINEMKVNSRFGIPAQDSVSKVQLHQLWLSVPSSLRAAVSKEINWELFLKTDNLASCKLILNDRELSDEKPKIIKNNHLNILEFVKNGNENLFFEFVNEIVIFKEWDEDIRGSLKILYELVFKGEIKSADDVLNSYPEEGKIDIKSKMDHELIVYYYILKDQFEAADEFLKWKFSGTEKIKELKANLLDNGFTFLYISNIWDVSKENVDVAKFKADRFLLWLLENDALLLNFKIEHIFGKNGIFNVKYRDWSFLIDHRHSDILEDFVDWCTSNAETAHKVKKEILRTHIHISSKLENYMAHNRIEEAERLLNYAFDSSDERKAFMQEFLLKEKYDVPPGVYACKLYVGKYSNPRLFEPKETCEEATDKLTKFVNFFIKPYLSSFDEFKSKFNNWPDKSKEFYKKERREESSSDDLNSEETDDECEYMTYCDAYNYKVFLQLLDDLESGSK